MTCRECKRGGSGKGWVFLYCTESGEVWVCGPRCLARYNTGEGDDRAR